MRGICVGLSIAALAVPAASAVTEPSFSGVVVEDAVHAFVFDRIGFDNALGDYVDEDAYRGTVETKVIRAPDQTYDFYFRFDMVSGNLERFRYAWQAAANYTVAHHVTFPEVGWAPSGPSNPAPGTTATGASDMAAFWGENGGGVLTQGILLLDTDAKGYAKTATFQVSDALDRLQGNYHGESPVFTTFGPSAPIPEPGTYALMLGGLGLVALARRRRLARR